MADDVWNKRALSFGQIAGQYDQYRPGYPNALFADLLGGLTNPRILEAGAGTGRATIELARRGATVDAVEPDAEMAAQITAHAGELRISVLVQPFETFTPEPETFDIVACAQAWHWIDPVVGSAIARTALKPGGTLAVWWNRPRSFTGLVWPAIMAAYQIHAPDLDLTHRLSDANAQEPLLATPPGFIPWQLTSYDWNQVYSTDEYIGVIGTHSDHIALAAMDRYALFDSVRVAIDTAGNGQLTYEYRTIMFRTVRI